MLTIKNLTKKYQNKKNSINALSEVNLKFPSRGLVSVIGRNGCGKSTLLGIIAGLIEPTSGEIFFDNPNNNEKTDFHNSQKNTTLVLQETFFVDYLSMKENMLLSVSNEVVLKNDNVLEELEIQTLLERKPKTLSGGQKQKFSILRSLLRKFDVLLVDEPTSSLDEQTETSFFNYIKQVSEKKLVIVVSHNMKLVNEYSDMIIKLVNGAVDSIKHQDELKSFREKNYIVSKLFSEDYYDWKEVKSRVHEMGEVRLIDADIEKKNRQEHFSLVVQPAISNRTILIHKSLSMVLKTIKRNFFKLFAFSILSSVFIVLLTLLVSLVFLDEASLQYKTFKTSNLEFVNFRNDSLFPIRDGYLVNDLNDLSPVSRRSDILLDFEADVSFSLQGGLFYFPRITGVTFQENRNNFIGKFPRNGEIMITDYHADMFLNENVYSSHENIIGNSVSINSHEFVVSAIMDTDYEIFIKDFSDENFQYTNKFLEWNNKFINIYSRIYYSKEIYRNNSTMFANYPIEYGRSFANILASDVKQLDIISEFVNSRGTICYVSESLYYFLNSPSSIKLFGMELEIKGVVSGTNPQIHLANEDDFASLIASTFLIQSINLYNFTLDDLRFLSEKKMKHNSALSDNLNGLFRAVNLLDQMFLFFVLILLFFVGLISVWLAFMIIESDKKLIRIAIYFGHPIQNIKKFQGYKFSLYFTLALILSFVFSIFLSRGINSFILSNAKMGVTLFSVSYLAFFGILLFLLIMTYLGFMLVFPAVNKKF